MLSDECNNMFVPCAHASVDIDHFLHLTPQHTSICWGWLNERCFFLLRCNNYVIFVHWWKPHHGWFILRIFISEVGTDGFLLVRHLSPLLAAIHSLGVVLSCQTGIFHEHSGMDFMHLKIWYINCEDQWNSYVKCFFVTTVALQRNFVSSVFFALRKYSHTHTHTTLALSFGCLTTLTLHLASIPHWESGRFLLDSLRPWMHPMLCIYLTMNWLMSDWSICSSGKNTLGTRPPKNKKWEDHEKNPEEDCFEAVRWTRRH